MGCVIMVCRGVYAFSMLKKRSVTQRNAMQRNITLAIARIVMMTIVTIAIAILRGSLVPI